MKFLYDLLPVILFFVTFKFAQGNSEYAADLCNSVLGSGFDATQAPIICATAIAIIASLLQVVYNLVCGKKVEPMLWISVAIILVFGSLTIWLHDEMFIKWKPTILYGVFAAILGFGQLTKRNFIKSILGKQISLPAKQWNVIQLSWIAFFVLVGILNVLVAYTCSTNFWVNFKLFGLMGLTLLFTVAIGFYITPYVAENNSRGNQK